MSLGTEPKPFCLLCGERGIPHLSGLKDRLFGVEGSWKLTRCGKCGLVWMDPMPLPEEIGKAYQRYYTHAEDDPQSKEVPRAPFLRRKLRRAYRWILRRLGVMRSRNQMLGMYLEGVPKGKVLEVGCGSGERLAKLASEGWAVEGQDVDPQSAHRVRADHDIPVLVGDLKSHALEAESFDCILMNHVIEHVHDPIGVLRECHRLLKVGGRLVMVTPNIEGMGARTFGPAWLSVDAPRHLHLYSPITLRMVAEQSGFQNPEVFTSVAHAELQAIHSLDIQARERTVMGEEPTWAHERWAMAFQIREAWTHRRDPSVGEEVVLIARKFGSGGEPAGERAVGLSPSAFPEIDESQ